MTATAVRLRRIRPLLAAGAVVGATTLALYLRDPHVEGSWGICPSAAMGFWCTFCGSLRAVNLITHGDLGAAASSNLVLVSMAPLAVALWAVALVGAWQGRGSMLTRRVPAAVTWTVVSLLLAFTVVRNLPIGAWFAP